jgi:myo-inositol-1(or 4)-monophosphatase
MPELIEVCVEAARAGGAVLQDWVGRFSARLKRPRDFVSEADLASQETIAQVIANNFPDHLFVGEEETAEISRSVRIPGKYHWIADPLDGTANYVRGVPHYAVSIGVERDGVLLAGVIYDPVLEECFTATAGGGAFLNGKSIQTSGIGNIEEALLAASFPPRVTPELPAVKEFVAFIQLCQGVRRGGSAALNLAYIAAGRYDGYWAADLHPWDAAAGVLLVQEAQGAVSSLAGGPFDPWNPKLLAASSSKLLQTMLSVIH